jgi:superoxide reductase
MTNVGEKYKCNICGNEVEVIHEGMGELICCGKPMQLEERKYTRKA